MNEVIYVGMADYKICRAPQRISTLGLGSCVGVVIYDMATKICGMAHVMMPDSSKITQSENRMKFADTCIADMYADMIKEGAVKSEMIVKIAGGARMFTFPSKNDLLNIGEQNVAAVHKVLEQMGLPIVAEDVGNNYGRTIEFDTVTGELNIKAVGIGDSVI